MEILEMRVEVRGTDSTYTESHSTTILIGCCEGVAMKSQSPLPQWTIYETGCAREKNAHCDQGEVFVRRLLQGSPHRMRTPLILYSSLPQG